MSRIGGQYDSPADPSQEVHEDFRPGGQALKVDQPDQRKPIYIASPQENRALMRNKLRALRDGF